MKQTPPKHWRLVSHANSVSLPFCLNESIRSISSEGSTIPVNRLTKESDHVTALATAESQRKSSYQQVRFSTRPPQMIPTKPKRRVKFAEDQNIVHTIESSTPPVSPCQLWYTEREYAALEQSRQEQCHYFGDRPWFSHLSRAFRALRDGDEVEDTTAMASTTSSSDMANLIGLEHWMINTARHTRRQEILQSIRHWQRTAPALPSVRQRQVARVSFQQSRPARQFASYVGQIVATSVQNEI